MTIIHPFETRMWLSKRRKFSERDERPKWSVTKMSAKAIYARQGSLSRIRQGLPISAIKILK